MIISKKISGDIRKVLVATTLQSDSIIENLSNVVATQKFVLTTILMFCLTLSVIATIAIAKSIVGPIQSVTHIMKQLSAGDTKIKLGYVGRHDEIGQMIEAIEVFRRNTIEIQGMQDSYREAEERGALTRKREMDALAAEFEASVKNLTVQLAESVTVVRSNAETMSKAANDTSEQSNSTVKT